MAEKITTRVIQISNVAPSASKDQMKTLFNHLGRIDEIKIYPKEGSEVQAAAKVCYVKYDDSTSVGVALHLTNTVFVDRALIVVPVMDGKIPDEQTALQLAPSAVAGMIPGQPTWPSNVISQLQGTGSNQVITTNDPRLNSLGLPQYPPLPGTTDPAKIEEIRRTVYVANLDPMVSPEQVMTFFSQVGEIKYVRMALEDSDGMKSAFVEFTDQRSVATSLTYNGVMFQGNHLRVLHSTAAINKPKTKLQEAAQREFEEAMKKVKEAQSLITAAADSGDTNIDKAVSRLASDMRSRSRSRSRRRRSRTRSRSRKRSRSRSRRSRSPRRSASRRSRSPPKRSPERRRSRSRKRSGSRTRRRSRSPKRRRSRSRSRKRHSKSRSKSRTKSGRPTPATTAGRRSRTPPPFRPRRSRSRTPKRSHSKGPRSRSAEKKRISRKSESASPPRLERQSSPGDDQASSASHKPDEKTNDNNSEQILDEPTPTLDKESDVKAGESSKPPKRRSSSRGRSGSKSPRKIRRSRSRSKSKGHRPSKKSSRRSRSGSRPRRRSRSRKRSRSRSGSRHRARKDKKKDRERSRERDKDKEKSKKKHKDREREREREKEEKKDTKVVRDYDEEEKIYDDDDKKTRDTDQEETENDAGSDSGDSEKRDDSNLQTVDMDMSE